MICDEHKQEAVSKCGWCSKPICEKCIAWAHQKKICPDCYAKLSKQGVNLTKKRTTGPVQNRDPSLTDERIEAGKKMLKGPEKERPRIRNVPDKEWR